MKNKRKSVCSIFLSRLHRKNQHLYSKFRIGHTQQCPCCTGSQTTGHLLQSCPTYEPLRKGIWPDGTPVARKLYGSLGTRYALPPSSRRLEFPSDERDEQEGGEGGGGEREREREKIPTFMSRRARDPQRVICTSQSCVKSYQMRAI